MKYYVTITEKFSRTVEVEAPNKEEAGNIVFDRYCDFTYVLTPKDYADTEFEVDEA